MSFTHLTFIFQFLLCVTAKKSFTLVIDSTYNMQHEVSIIKYNIGWITNLIASSPSVENYLFVPIDDSGVGSVKTFSSPDQFVQSIQSLQVSNGHEMLINSLSGLEKALQESKPDSNIFLFTNKCARDDALFSNIQYLCRMTRSKVVIFASGNCANSGTSQHGNIGVYHDVCKVCSGNVFRFEPANLRQAFSFMREIVKDEYNEVTSFESFTGYRQLFFTADSFTRDAIVAVSGDSPGLHLLEESGQSPRTEKLIDTRHSLVVRIVEPHIGQYQVNVRCQGVTSVTIYKRNDFPFKIGFSGKYPRSVRETASRPLPGQENYILVALPRNNNFQLKTFEVLIVEGDVRQNLNLVEVGLNSGIYVTQTFFEARRAFRLKITGRESNSYEDFAMTTNILDPQVADTNAPWSAPSVEIIKPESPLTDYEKNATVACRVTGSPTPNIWWEDESEQQMAAEVSILEYPATFISYISIPSLKENRTVFCKASTLKGGDSKSIQLYVYRPYVFEMIQIPKDATFEYESEGRLFCEVRAYPEAEIKWYHNDSLLENTQASNVTSMMKDDNDKSKFEYYIEDQALVIRNMTTHFTGTYKCEVHNAERSKSFTVTVNISGLEPPEIETETTELTSKLGDEVKMACRISKGRPKPVLTWKYKSLDGYDFTDIPNDISVEGGNVAISEVKSKHKGTYKCEVVNDQGHDSREVTLNVHYAPIIKDSETTTRNVIEDSPGFVELKCSVDADPKATVKWERSQDGGDGYISLDDISSIDEDNTYRFHASMNDSGTYRCTAENEAGMAEKVTTVNVLVPPYITSVSKTMTARVGSDAVLLCVVQYANPAPSLTWRFTGLDFTSTILFRGEGIYSKEIHLQNLSKANSGTYLCMVENSVGTDRIHISLNVI